MFFGTMHRLVDVGCPVVGTDFSSVSWGSGGSFLSGGGFEVGAADSHKEYSLQWSSASTIPEAQVMQAMRDGVYSKSPRDLFFFHEPLSLDKNILPKRWAAPHLFADAGRQGFARRAGYASRGFPLNGAQVDVPATFSPTQPGRNALFVPIPAGYVLRIAQYTATGSSGGMKYKRVQTGVVQPTVTGLPASSPVVIDNSTGALTGILLFPQGSFGLYGMRAVLYKAGESYPANFGTSWTWLPGMGHSGCRFTMPPTYVPQNGVGGGMASFSASLREVGDWLQ